MEYRLTTRTLSYLNTRPSKIGYGVKSDAKNNDDNKMPSIKLSCVLLILFAIAALAP